MAKNILDLLDELRAIAQLGLNYSKDPYDLERYHRLMDLAAGEYASISGLESKVIKERFAKDLGYITPKLGVQGALFNEQGEMLLERRKDDGTWGLPSGWAEVNETPQQTLEREFMEEANLKIEVGELIDFRTRLPSQYEQPHTSYHLMFAVSYISGEIQISHESLDMRFRDHQQVEEWHKDHGMQADKAFAYWETQKS